MRKHLQDVLKTGIIKESRSLFASPITNGSAKRISQKTRKKNGSVRICIDYPTLNSRTVSDKYTTLCIDDTLDCLAGSQWFSVLDLRSGYYQIAMAPENKEKTGFWSVLVCLDDLIVFRGFLQEHEEWLFRVLDRLEDV